MTRTPRSSGTRARSASRPKSDYTIQTVQNALRLLAAFDHQAELGVSELSRRLGLHKNNVFRLLATLEQEGYIEQCADTDRYRLGVACVERGRALARHRDLLRCGRPVLEELVRECGETAHIAVRRHFEVVQLEGHAAHQSVVATSRAGTRAPLHACALGKVLLACAEPSLPEEFDRQVVSAPGVGLARLTENTIVDAHKFFEHLRGVAASGFAIDLDEYELGLRCVAAPVHDATGALCGALSVSSPASRLSEDREIDALVEVTVAAAARLSRALGAPTQE